MSETDFAREHAERSEAQRFESEKIRERASAVEAAKLRMWRLALIATMHRRAHVLALREWTEIENAGAALVAWEWRARRRLRRLEVAMTVLLMSPIALAPCALAWSFSPWWVPAPWLVAIPLRLAWWRIQREILARHYAHVNRLTALTAQLGVE